MTCNVWTVTLDASLAEVVHLMERHNIKRIPVVEANKIVGIVTRANLLHAMVSFVHEVPASSIEDAAIREQFDRISARGPFPARAQIVFGPIAPGSSFDLPAGVEFDAVGPSGVFPFCTVRGVHLARTTLSAIQVEDGSGALVSYSRDLADGLPIVAFSKSLRPALYLGFEVLPSAVPVALWFWFAGPEFKYLN
jgi:hypothetical protein